MNDRILASVDTPQYLLSLDQGTTSSRAIVFDRSGNVISVAQREYRQFFPKPGWVEQDPHEIWESQYAVAVEALERAALSLRSVAALGVTNQRETTIVWERATGEPVYPAIVWQDRRTADECRQWQQRGLEAEITQRTGLRLDPYFSATKIRWILENVSGARARAEAGDLLFGTVDSWLMWRLTGGRLHATDITNASRTLLMNLHSGDWDPELLKLFEIPRCMLPEIRSSAEVFGHVDGALSLAGVPIAGVAGDQHAALFGQGCFQAGMAKNTYGTGCFLLMNTGEQVVASKNHLLTTVAWRVAGRTEYALEGSVFIGGAAIKWLRDELQLVQDVEELDRLAASVPDAAGMIFVPAFTGLGAPYWDPYARGGIFGLTRGVNRAHFCRAALEAIALQTAELLQCMEKDSGIELRELRVDGGASRSLPLLQIQADLLGTTVLRPRCVETTAFGAAYLAGLGVGFWSDRAEIARQWQPDLVVPPKASRASQQPLWDAWKRAVGRVQEKS